MGVVTFLDLSLFQSGGGGGDPTKFAPKIIWSDDDTVILDAGITKLVAVDAPDGDAWTITSEVDGFTPVSGTGATFAYVTFPENTGETAREIVLVVTGQYGSNSITITQREPLYLVATYSIDNVGEQEIFDSGHYMFQYDYFTVDEDPTHVTGYTYNFQTTGEHTLTFHLTYAGIRNYFKGNVTSLNIPDIELIPKGAFLGMTGLTSVVYDGKEITRNAFSGCTSLTSFTAPNMEIIGESAFKNCSSLTSIDLTNVKRIDNYGLAYCTSLTALTIPDNCQTDPSIINYCSGLTELHVGSGVTTFSLTNYITAATYGDQTKIGNWAGKLHITTVEVGNNCTFTGSFSGCPELTAVTFGTGYTEIKANMFSGCYSFNNIKWKRGETVIGQDDVITIPAEITSIGQSAFRTTGATSETAAKAVVFENRSTNCTVANHAFRGMKITGATVNSYAIISSANNCFAECSNLSVFNGLYGSISGGMFKDCKALEYVNSETQGAAIIQEGATTLGNNAFMNCSGITTVDIPSTVVGGDTPFSGSSVSVIIARPTTAPKISLTGMPVSGTLYTPADADYSTWLAELGEGWTQETIPA